MVKDDFFNQIFQENINGKKYFVFDNGKKTWIIPTKNMNKGFGIYQASNIKGKIMKTFFPMIRWSKIVRKIAKCRIKKLSLRREIIQIIEKYCSEDYQCSVYYGNLDESQQNAKATIQVFNQNNIFIFIKVTNNEENKKTFVKEKRALQYLERKKIVNIPKCISIEKFGGWSAFVQDTTNKKIKSSFIFSEAHWEFLINIYNATKCIDKYQNSDICVYFNKLSVLMENNPQLDKNNILGRSLAYVKSWLEADEKIYTFAHGDFTPWNTYVVEGKIYVYDFEYCLKRSVPFFDFFHFICQKNLIKRGMDTKSTIREYNAFKQRMLQFIDEPDKAFCSYLLYIITFYFVRTKNQLDLEDRKIKYRLKLLQILIEKEV